MNRSLVLPFCIALSAPLVRAQAGDFDTWIGYETRVYSGSTWPYDLAVADLDLDGSPDAAIASHWATAELTLLWNRGDGSFEPPQTHPQSQPSYAVLAADLDGDGLPELASTNYGTHGAGASVAVFHNLGDRQFAPAVDHAALAGPVGLVADDFDQDGNADLAVAGYGHIGQGSQVALLLGDGSGGFAPPLLFAAGAKPYRLASGDLNGDALPDLVVGRDTGKLSVLLNTGGGFAPPVFHDVSPLPQGGDVYPNVHVADSDHDGDLDVFYSSTKTSQGGDPSFGAIAILRNDGSGALAPSLLVPLVTWLGGAAQSVLADVDGDGWLDVFTAHLDAGGWTYMHADGSGGFLQGREVPAGQAGSAVAVADADGDGLLDALVLNRDSFELYVHRNLGNGEFAVHPGRDLQGANNDIAAADVDHDGDLNVAASGAYAGNGNVELLLNLGNGSFANPVQIHVGEGAMAVKLTDLSGDGWPDLLWCDHPTAPPYDFWTALNDGAGGYLTPTEWPANTCGNGDVEAFDMDGDGDLNVFLAEYLGCGGSFGNRMFIHANRGDGTFDPPTVHDCILRPERIAHGDLDGDGDEDLAYSVAAGVEIALSNGDGSFQPSVPIALPGGGNDLVLGDLNLDGALDLAVSTANGPQGVNVHVLSGAGDGGFGAPTSYVAGYSPDLVNADELLAEDVDGDGDLDLLALNGGDGDASLLRNRGDGTFLRQVRYGLGPTSVGFTHGDFNGDGAGDLVASVGIPPYNLSKEVVTVRGRGLCPRPTNYCEAKVNSLGREAWMASTGTPSAFAGDFTIQVHDAVPGQPGIAFYGTNGPASLPFHNGTLCVQAPLVRMPVRVLDPEGRASYELTVPTAWVGTSRWYQFWYRDPAHPDGTNVSLSDALAVTFCE